MVFSSKAIFAWVLVSNHTTINQPKAGADDIMGQWPFLDFNGPRPNYSSVNLPIRFAIGSNMSNVWSSPPFESQLAHLRANKNSWVDLVAPSSVHIPIALSAVTTKSKKVKYPFIFSFHNSSREAFLGFFFRV